MLSGVGGCICTSTWAFIYQQELSQFSTEESAQMRVSQRGSLVSVEERMFYNPLTASGLALDFTGLP